MVIAKAASKKIFDLLFSAHGKKITPPQPIFMGLGVKKLANYRNTVLSLLKNTKRRPSIKKSRPSANKLA